MFSESADRQTSFSGWGNVWKIMSFSRHIANKFPRPIIIQLNIKGLTARNINVFCYLVLQFEAFVILLQETHCTNVEKLVLPSFQLAGFYLSRKHGLATFAHQRLRYIRFEPISTDIED